MDLHEALQNNFNLLNHELSSKITVIKDYGDIPLITCSPAELNPVFRNILQNAIQSIPGKGKITIRTFKKKNNIFIQIIDTGIGISSKKMKNLFEPIFSKKGNRVKAGMGLFISLNIVQKHHGQIKIESEGGKGSTFTIILPENKI